MGTHPWRDGRALWGHSCRCPHSSEREVGPGGLFAEEWDRLCLSRQAGLPPWAHLIPAGPLWKLLGLPVDPGWVWAPFVCGWRARWGRLVWPDPASNHPMTWKGRAGLASTRGVQSETEARAWRLGWGIQRWQAGGPGEAGFFMEAVELCLRNCCPKFSAVSAVSEGLIVCLQGGDPRQLHPP